jgi:hypothetical protein
VHLRARATPRLDWLEGKLDAVFKEGCITSHRIGGSSPSSSSSTNYLGVDYDFSKPGKGTVSQARYIRENMSMRKGRGRFIPDIV